MAGPLILTTRQGKGSKLTIQEMDDNLIYLDNKYQYTSVATITYQDINNLFGLPQFLVPFGGISYDDIVIQNVVDPNLSLVSILLDEEVTFSTGYYFNTKLHFWVKQNGNDIVVTPVLDNLSTAFISGQLVVKALFTPAN